MSQLLTFARNNKKEAERFSKFMVVGAIGFVVDAGTLFLFTRGLHLVLIVAQVFSFTAAVISNFIWNRYWTYPESRSKPIRRQLTQFFAVNLAGLGIRSVIIWLVQPLYERLSWLQTLIPPKLISDYAALATAVVAVLLWNFFINRFWTYNDVS